ncbi:MAG: zinc-ribbon domain-containing protein [Myxococcota bacterium]|jgi:predicted Zn finger-like uncharacterized protein|nr:zinc-ribbon domain-containing protein [Myxococcota bacterium]
MKIVCQKCSAKYSISDEKVQGKTFKIRCRKCGESIVVRGDAQGDGGSSPYPSMPPGPGLGAEEEGDAETRVFDYSGYQAESPASDNVEWHIVVDGTQQGPYTAEQLKEYITTGSLDLEAYVWRDGFADWIPAREVREFADAIGTAARAPIPQGPKGFEPARIEEPIATRPSDGIFAGSGGGGLLDAVPQGSPMESPGSLFGSATQTKEYDVFGPPGQKDADLFGTPQAPPATGGLFSNDKGLFGPTQPGEPDDFNEVSDIFNDSQPRAAAELFGSSGQAKGGASPRLAAEQVMLTGQRNENSVLFSLSSLQSLADAQGVKKSPVVTSTGGSEGSGLIDIRALAGSLQQVESAETGSASPPVDDLMSIGGYGGGLTAPVLAAMRQGMSTGTKIALVAGSFVLAGIIVVLAVLLAQKPDAPSADVQALMAKIAELEKKGGTGSTQMAELQAELAKAQGEAPAKVENPGPTESQEQPSGTAGSPKSADKEVGKRDRSMPKGAGVSSSLPSDKPGAVNPSADSPREANPAGPAEPREPKDRKPAAPSSELDDLLGDSKGSLAQKKPAAEPAKPAEPAQPAKPDAGGGGGAKDSLDRVDVQTGMNSVAAAVKQCGQGEQGTVTVQVVIGTTGRVVTAEPTGSYGGTPVGACVARAVRNARFPASKNNMSVRYPFKL